MKRMYRKIAAVVALLLMLGMGLQAQLAEKANFFGGITYQFVGLTAPNAISANPIFYVYGLGAGMDYVLAHSNDVVSLGFNPNANLCFQLSNYYGFNFLASVPAYMLARVGAGATPFNEQRFGIGAGIGGTGSYFLSSFGAKTLFFNPSAVAEVSLRTRGSNYLFRLNWSLLRPSRELDFGGSTPVPYRVGLTGISIFYTF